MQKILIKIFCYGYIPPTKYSNERMAKDIDSLQLTLSFNCPVIYGNATVPLCILFVITFICLLCSCFLTLKEVLQKKRRSIKSKTFVLFFITMFFFLRCFVILVPLKYTFIFYSLFCYQAPRFITLICWEFMVLWILPSITISTQNSCRKKFLFPIPFLLFDGLMLILMIINSIISSNQKNITEAITNFSTVTFSFIIVFSLTIVVIRLLKSQNLVKQVRWRAIVLCITSGLHSLISFARFIWNLCDLLNSNSLKILWREAFTTCQNEETKCWIFLLYNFGFYFIFETIPPLLLLSAFALTNMRFQQKSKHTKEMLTKRKSKNSNTNSNFNFFDKNRSENDKSASKERGSTIDDCELANPLREFEGDDMNGCTTGISEERKEGEYKPPNDCFRSFNSGNERNQYTQFSQSFGKECDKSKNSNNCMELSSEQFELNNRSRSENGYADPKFFTHSEQISNHDPTKQVNSLEKNRKLAENSVAALSVAVKMNKEEETLLQEEEYEYTQQILLNELEEEESCQSEEIERDNKKMRAKTMTGQMNELLVRPKGVDSDYPSRSSIPRHLTSSFHSVRPSKNSLRFSRNVTAADDAITTTKKKKKKKKKKLS